MTLGNLAAAQSSIATWFQDRTRTNKQTNKKPPLPAWMPRTGGRLGCKALTLNPAHLAVLQEPVEAKGGNQEDFGSPKL